MEEGSRRLAMAHSEIRRLTDELESAHLTQRAYGERYYSAILEMGYVILNMCSLLSFHVSYLSANQGGHH